jgi:hypothetical protein
MGPSVDDFYPLLRATIAEAKTAGLLESASKLEARAFAAYTTSSELLGETGQAILEFLDSKSTVPAVVRANLEYCLMEIRKVWPEL